MSDIQPIVNRVSQSGLITLDLSTFLPKKEILELDIKDFLFKELLLKEKDFRQAMKEHQWEKYQDKNLAVFCSTDAIVPHWAYMLIVSLAQPFANFIAFGNKEKVHEILFSKSINEINAIDYSDKRVIIKGCGSPLVGAAAYLEISKVLRPHVKSLMYGEACSNVPIYKQKKEK